MRIPEGPPRIEISPTQGAVKVQPTRPVGGDATRATSGDDVRVSARGRELSLQTEGTMDTAKVDRLKSAIESGSFRVDPRAIAERMVRGG